jgi:hypothetical protein
VWHAFSHFQRKTVKGNHLLPVAPPALGDHRVCFAPGTGFETREPLAGGRLWICKLSIALVVWMIFRTSGGPSIRSAMDSGQGLGAGKTSLFRRSRFGQKMIRALQALH